MSGEFKDIRIIGVNKKKTKNAGRGEEDNLYVIFFDLSEKPPVEWERMFNANHEYLRKNNPPFSHAPGDHYAIEQTIVLHSNLEDIQKHLDYIKERITVANRDYRNKREKREAGMKRLGEWELNEQKKIDEALSALDFD